MRELESEQKRYEQDQSLVNNRVNHLNSIEAKMLKKIEMTRKAAEKIQRVKEENKLRYENRINAIKADYEDREQKKLEYRQRRE